MNALRRTAILAAIAGLILAACGGSDGGGTVAPGEPLTIRMTEYAFDPAAITIPAGEEVTLEFVNDGTLPHEFMAGHAVSEDDGTPHGFDEDLFAGVDVTVEPASAQVMDEGMDDMESTEHDDADASEHDDMGTETEMDDHADDEMGHGFMILAQPGETVTITFTLPADRVGEWTMGCFEQNGSHWTQGMEGTITVTE